ncbi:uncharacterized protein LOC131670293 isoform X2 [Phymastichus coffea]|uniref:uncharacterized protein LOC131670293 isoform X2 n=1 Tax=Phymastichus coffea TaxID=108790 RepID=UPI00273CDDBA|nr:uncharacterized protein LOC131670293 isoform X2 [Phymastichus coffea]
MTMTSVVALGPPGSLAANMLGPKRYHLQQGLDSSAPSKGYETLSKAKKSWSVRLGLSRGSSRQHDVGPPAQSRQPQRQQHQLGWGTVSGGSVLAQQMVYGEPWLYGTVRGSSTRPAMAAAAAAAAAAVPSVLLVCSCPEFLHGSARDLGSDCRKCGGYRLAGLAVGGGTCRVPTCNVRPRPSLAGMLRPSGADDPYDLMRRSRLAEPRSRARSTSPLRQSGQRDARSQSAASRRSPARKVAAVEPVSRTEWFAERAPPGAAPDGPGGPGGRPLDDCGEQAAEPQQARGWPAGEEPGGAGDSRKSILECDVNPYLLLKDRQPARSEDELSDELSDNALERELLQSFDPSKVKSIDRSAAHCRSSVAAIGGQRVRVCHEPREVSDEEDGQPAGPQPPCALTRIPIPKISPKRPPRRPKEPRAAPRSILKRADRAAAFAEAAKRKSVLFNVDNVILAPEKPADLCLRYALSVRRAVERTPHGRALLTPGSSARSPPRKTCKSTESDSPSVVGEAPIVPEEAPQQQQQLRFITIPNIRSPRQQPPPPPPAPTQRPPEAKIVPRVKSVPPIDKIKIDKFVPSKKQQLHHQHQAHNRQQHQQQRQCEDEERTAAAEASVDDERAAPAAAVGGGKPSASLSRSQSERSNARPEISATDVSFVDTMRLSLCRRARDEDAAKTTADGRPEEARRRLAVERESSIEEPSAPEPEAGETGGADAAQEAKPAPAESEGAPALARAARPSSWSPSGASNVCKITVSPRSAPASLMVHRLQVGSTPSATSGSSRATSITINGEQDSGNKVTISVGGQDSPCNPTVISVTGSAAESPASARTSSEQKRTLVILDNYKSNIVISGDRPEQARRCGAAAARPIGDSVFGSQRRVQVASASKPIEIKPRLKFKEAEESPDNSPRWKQILDARASSQASKEEIISKLLEDSLRKARENGEVLDESSGEAILKILKQSLLKSSASRLEPECGYFRPPSSGMFLEENAYEVIKEPIYEEIPDEPPPLPLSPPPSDDFLKNRVFFGDEYKDSFGDLGCGAYYKPLGASSGQYLDCSYLSKSPDDSFNKTSSSAMSEKLLNFIMDSEKRTRVGNVSLDHEEDVDEEQEEEEEEEEDDDDDEEEEDEEEEEDPERDLEALYEQKETSLGDLSSKSSQISNVSDSSEECNIILTNSPEALKTRAVDIERTDSGVGSESSQASSGRGGGVARRWRNSSHCNGNFGSGSGKGGAVVAPPAATVVAATTAVTAAAAAAAAVAAAAAAQISKPDVKHCEDCEQRLEPLVIDSLQRSPAVCRKCGKKRAERKEIVTEIVETEQKYGRDLQIILEEFHRPMLRAGLLTPEQLSAIFLNVEELLEHNQILADKLKEAVNEAQAEGDEDLVSVDLGKIFLESERMLHAFESYCTRQGGASLLLQNLEKEKELLRIFLKVSQMENTVLRRMNLNSFLMVPVQRVTKYPLLLARLQKATPSGKPDMQELKKRLKQAQSNIELHLEHMNAEAKDITSTKLWRRISIIQNGRRSAGEQDMVNIKLRKMAVEVLEWPHEDSRFVLEGRLLVAQPTDNNWRRGRTVKLAPVTAMLVTNGKPNGLQQPSSELLQFSDDSLFPRQIAVKDATLLLVKEKLGRYSLLREPLYLDKCIVCCETDLEDYFEIQELSSKETFIFKAEDGARTKRWCRTLQAHAQSLGAWRRRRGALPNIMICGVARS